MILASQNRSEQSSSPLFDFQQKIIPLDRQPLQHPGLRSHLKHGESQHQLS
ncbi:hypothetical protein SynA15127_00601 [Synechococcus sp. A15-127]|nr:hypothetical protein SynA15127_00601 [Synechococcus sp. A15-127]